MNKWLISALSYNEVQLSTRFFYWKRVESDFQISKFDQTKSSN